VPDAVSEGRHPAFSFRQIVTPVGIIFSCAVRRSGAVSQLLNLILFVYYLASSIIHYDYTAPPSSARWSLLFFASGPRQRHISGEIEIRRLGI
jgi:hypothetical protein